MAMQALKDAIIASPTLISIDYTSNCPIYLAVDSFICRVGWILSQDCTDGQCCPARFRSIFWNECESCYLQVKLELYSLFRMLRSMHLYLIGIWNLVVEMDASFICGMLNNPDCQPNTTINQWITAIHLFNFKLAHVPMEKHHGPDGLSHRAPIKGKDDAEGDPEEWIDCTLSLSLWATSWLPAHFSPLYLLSLLVHSSGNTPAEVFSSSMEFHTAEDKVACYLTYLCMLKLPLDLHSHTLNHFLCKIKSFSLQNRWLWWHQQHSHQQLFIPLNQHFTLICAAHDELGHRGFYSTHRTITNHFWWPSLKHNIRWYVDTCHTCQLHQTTKVHIPPTITPPAPLFCKAYIDTMLMPLTGGFCYITQARCSLTAWPEWHACYDFPLFLAYYTT